MTVDMEAIERELEGARKIMRDPQLHPDDREAIKPYLDELERTCRAMAVEVELLRAEPDPGGVPTRMMAALLAAQKFTAEAQRLVANRYG